ncbi:MAG: hypothetical protein GTN93_31935, partial [Anaerolineae bacterium]|nr:hypothetical protein [Anaerolineae bacterium]
MALFITERMRSGFSRFREEEKLEYEGGLLKTYLVEANLDGSRTGMHDAVASLLQCSVPGASVHPTDEEALVVFSAPRRRSRQRDTYYLDVQDPRYWMLHTLALARDSDDLVRKWISGNSRLDSAWFPMQFLDSIRRLGQFKGYGGRFSNEPFERDEDKQHKVSMKLWGDLAAEVLAVLVRTKPLDKMFCLSSVRLKSTLEDEAFVVDDIGYSGKVTAMGDSYVSHIDLVTRVFRRQYRDIISGILEQQY